MAVVDLPVIGNYNSMALCRRFNDRGADYFGSRRLLVDRYFA